MTTTMQQRNTRTAVIAFAVVAGMVGLAFGFVPLYRLVCQVTGLAGTPSIASEASVQTIERVMTVRFDANIQADVPWDFKPMVKAVDVKLGETRVINYRAHNLSDKPVTGISTFNVTPIKAAQYFTKIECFCFIEQTLAPGEEVLMPVQFYIDPALAEDSLADDVTTVTLSYTFYRSLDDVPLEEEAVEAEPATTHAALGAVLDN